MAPLIAIVGCDGAGKSTLVADLAKEIARRRPVATSYLGLGSSAIGERIKQWPLIGPPFERLLARKARQTRTKGEKIPGLATAAIVFALSIARRRRFAKAMALRKRGIVVLADRFPQVEIAGLYDGPGLSAAKPDNRAVAALAARERAIYEEMVRQQPTLVIRLRVDAETAHARKPEHSLELLRHKAAITPLLTFGGAPIVDVDTSAPYAQVRQHALAAIDTVLG